MTVLVTGSAGFIGSEVAIKLLNSGKKVVGIDNHNDYYDIGLKESRLDRFKNNPNYHHIRLDLTNKKKLENVFSDFHIEEVVHLAAQAGVRYSIDNPLAYIDSNIVGFINVLECCRRQSVTHLVYASSSSVYGANKTMPFSVNDNVDHPVSLYAATKKSNELMAHTYSHLFNIPTTGLRFFTVYGPWGRPDMSPFKFARAIMEDKPIDIYNFGKHQRDFTYIDDIVDGVLRVLKRPAESDIKWDGHKPDSGTSFAPWRIYNIGNGNPVELMDYINMLEKALGKNARKNFLPMQPGDVLATYADLEGMKDRFGYEPQVNIIDGVNRFTRWFKEYYYQL